MKALLRLLALKRLDRDALFTVGSFALPGYRCAEQTLSRSVRTLPHIVSEGDLTPLVNAGDCS